MAQISKLMGGWGGRQRDFGRGRTTGSGRMWGNKGQGILAEGTAEANAPRHERRKEWVVPSAWEWAHAEMRWR